MTGAHDHDGGPASQAHLGRYKLIATLGHGGMADVYLAVAQGPVGFNKLLVVKCLRPDLAEEPDFLTMFLDEARLAARLHHPNVVQTNEVGEATGCYFIAMEYLAGQPLNRVLTRMRKVAPPGLSMEACVSIVVDALAGLQYAHDLLDYAGTPLNVVHRDASPHNIFVTYNGHVKMVDFGIAKAASRSAQSRTGTLKGKIAYMAPEQARCEDVDRRADVFSLGIVLWEAITGRRMWVDYNEFMIIDRLDKSERLPLVRSVRPDAPVELEAICARALALDPVQRYPTAAEMRAALLNFLDTRGLRPASHEDIGRQVATAFTEERTKIQSAIDSQLAALERKQHAEISVIDLRSLASTGSRAPARIHSAAPIEVIAHDGEGTAPTLARAATAESMGPPPKRSPLSALFIGLGATAVGGLLALAMLWRPMPAFDGTTTAPASQASAPATEASEAEASPTQIQLDIEVRPAEATIEIDDAQVARGRYANTRPHDGEVHVLVVQAQGYVTERRELRFDDDVQLLVELEQATERTAELPPSAKLRGNYPPADKPPDSPKTGDKPAGNLGKPGKPKKRKLDPDDPWAE